MNEHPLNPVPAHRNTSIEYLRALAIGLTLIHHLNALFFWSGADYEAIRRNITFWGGVDLFFCISGYVIALSVLQRIPATIPPSGHRALTFAQFAIPFWIRRAWRLWPNALLWIAIPGIASLIFTQSGAFVPARTFMADGLAALLHVANFHWYDCFNNQRGLCGFPTQVGVYWSLSLEEQFYLVFPFLAIFAGKKYLPWWLGVIIAVQLPLERGSWASGWGFRTDAMCIGVLIALFTESPLYQAIRPQFSRAWHKHTLQAFLIVLLMVLPAEPTIVRFSTGLMAIVCGLLVWIASYDTPSSTNEGIWNRLTLWIASRSYSIYLIHMSAFAFTREIWFHIMPLGTQFTGRYTLRFALTALILMVLAVELSYRLIETPCRKRGVAIAKRMEARIKASQGETANA